MTKWMLRGLVFAGGMLVVRLLQGALINAFQTQAALISIVLLLIFIAGVVAWGVLDGRADAAANPDPDRRGDLAMIWLLAGLVAGILSGFLAWLIALVYDGLYTGGLIQEISTFAAFTALVVFLGGIGGAAIGRWRIDRTGAYAPRSDDEEERVDTDVFAAVGAGDATAHGSEATAQGTEAPAYAESPTEEIKLDEVQQRKSEEQ